MTRFHITTHGCRVNRVESDAIAAQLLAAGWEQAALEDADIALLNTCTVTGEADHKNRKAIRQALKRQPGPVLVTGCAVNISAAGYEEIDPRVVCMEDKSRVAQVALELATHAAHVGTGPTVGDRPHAENERGQAPRLGTGPSGRNGDSPRATGGQAPAAGTGTGPSVGDRPQRQERGQAPRLGTGPDDRNGDRPRAIGGQAPKMGTGPDSAGGAHGDRPLSSAKLVPYGAGFRTRSGIKVQDGCDNACTFCIVHTARGPARSENPREVLRQARELVDAGARELVLAGIDTGAYSWQGMDLAGLVELLLSETDVGRIRIPSIEPQSVSDSLIDLMARSEGRLCRHLHLVMQSGSSKVLREMARHYSAQEFLDLAQELRRRVDGIALSTDVIVGFPGETQDDFDATMEMVRACGFMKLHIFPYSKRPGTPAAARTDQLAPQLASQRAAQLAALGRELALEDARRRLGSIEAVIVERPGRGTAESFHEVRFSAPLEEGSLLPMRLEAIGEDGNIVASPL